MSYDVGDAVTISTTVKNPAGTLTDATMSLTVTKPDASTTTPSITHTGTGAYSATVTADQAGTWLYRWTATGALTAAENGQFSVVAQAAKLVSVEDTRAHLNIPATTTANDAELRGFIDAAQVVVEGIVGPVAPRSVTEVFDGGTDAILLSNRNVVSITSVTENRGLTTYTLTEQPLGSSVDAFGYTWDRTINKIVRRGFGGGTVLFPDGVNVVQVVYLAGLALVPANVRLATLELIRHWWQFGQQGNRPAFGNAGADLPTVPSGFAVPNRVLELLNPTRRAPGIG